MKPVNTSSPKKWSCSATSKPFFFFERALKLHAPDLVEERERLQDEHGQNGGYNLWAEKYKVPIRATAQPGSDGFMVCIMPKMQNPLKERTELPRENTFTFRARRAEERPPEYLQDMDTAFKQWKREVGKREKRAYKPLQKVVPDMQQMYHAEWYMLNKLAW